LTLKESWVVGCGGVHQKYYVGIKSFAADDTYSKDERVCKLKGASTLVELSFMFWPTKSDQNVRHEVPMMDINTTMSQAIGLL